MYLFAYTVQTVWIRCRGAGLFVLAFAASVRVREEVRHCTSFRGGYYVVPGHIGSKVVRRNPALEDSRGLRLVL